MWEKSDDSVAKSIQTVSLFIIVSFHHYQNIPAEIRYPDVSVSVKKMFNASICMTSKGGHTATKLISAQNDLMEALLLTMSTQLLNQNLLCYLLALAAQTWFNL